MNEENPFIKDLVIDVGGKVIDYFTYIKDKQRYDDDNDPPTVHLERAEKVYFYTKRKKALRSALGKLSGPATQLFLWIMISLEYGKDYIKFTDKEFLTDTGMSHHTLKKAKKELIGYSVIAQGNGKKHYWINPAIMFKGSRVKKFPDNLRVYQNKNLGNNSMSNTKI